MGSTTLTKKAKTGTSQVTNEIRLHDLITVLRENLRPKMNTVIRRTDTGLRALERKLEDVCSRQNPPISGISRTALASMANGDTVSPDPNNIYKLWLLVENLYQYDKDLFYPDTQEPIHFEKFEDFLLMIQRDQINRKQRKQEAQKKESRTMEPAESQPLTLKDIIVYTLRQNGWEFEPHELDIEANLSPGTTLSVLKRNYTPSERELLRYVRVLRDPHSGALFPNVDDLLERISKPPVENGESHS